MNDISFFLHSSQIEAISFSLSNYESWLARGGRGGLFREQDICARTVKFGKLGGGGRKEEGDN